MKRWIAIGFVTVFVMTLALTLTLSAPAEAAPQCCTMWWKPCPLGGFEIGSLDHKWGCGHYGTVCDAYCLIP